MTVIAGRAVPRAVTALRGVLIAANCAAGGGDVLAGIEVVTSISAGQSPRASAGLLRGQACAQRRQGAHHAEPDR
ncbi:hypothetical protein [Jatrophihabitans lederbergiae]|uniref:Uncharacterized protein n=1 Tax=Jatrophihabitans lederbergiae TaxID=3075547 RepID=A0ABU2JGA4_9ACTN|nr:hypothetical protein [Jatrophihabitans sp. DSM 44399]MDT0264017.1 hypothetical protein [Jatrophihabitans sp. DSM 44399]